MDLYVLLEIDRKLLKPEHYPAMGLTFKIWQERGRPTDRAHLAEALEQAIQRNQANGYVYPPVLLKRKRSLDRGEWMPVVEVTVVQTQVECAECGGTGYKAIAGGASLCGCGAWKKKDAQKP